MEKGKFLPYKIGPIVHGTVDGEEHRDGLSIEARSPFDQSSIGHCWQATWADAEEAVTAAVAGLAHTSRLGAWERQNVL